MIGLIIALIALDVAVRKDNSFLLKIYNDYKKNSKVREFE